MDILDNIESVRVYTPQPGDVVFVRVAKRMDAAFKDQLCRQVERIFEGRFGPESGIRVAVIDPELSVEVIRDGARM
jgi:hypothetical protein